MDKKGKEPEEIKISDPITELEENNFVLGCFISFVKMLLTLAVAIGIIMLLATIFCGLTGIKTPWE